MREPRDPSCPRLVGEQSMWATASEAALPLDRAGDHPEPLGVRRRDELGPVGSRLDPVGQLGAVLARAWLDFDLGRRRLAPELGEPGSILGDEVEGKPVAPRRHRRSHPRVEGHALTWCDDRERGPFPVPDDRVVPVVEPVVAEEDPVAPRHRPGVRERHPGGRERAGLRPFQPPVSPLHGKRPFGHWAASLGRWNRSSCAPRGASRPSGRRSGSCGRRGGRCRSTARSARSTPSSRSTGRPSSPPR